MRFPAINEKRQMRRERKFEAMAAEVTTDNNALEAKVVDWMGEKQAYVLANAE